MTSNTDEAAIDWFVRLHTTKATKAELREHANWLEDKHAHQTKFTEIERNWELTATLRSWAFNELAYLNQKHSAQQIKQRKRAFQSLSAVAAIVFAVLIWPLFNSNSDRYQTAPYEQSRLALSDGSRMHLNVNTKVDVQYSSKRRNVTLTQGEGLFDVVHDAQRKFVVSIGRYEVIALGTRFAVNTLQDGTLEIIVEEGRVAVTRTTGRSKSASNNGGGFQEIIVAANERLSLDLESQAALVEAVTAKHLSAWSEAKLIFESTPLAEVAAEISRYIPETIEVSARLSDERVSGLIHIGNVENMLALLAGVVPVEPIEMKPGVFVLAPIKSDLPDD